MTKTRSLLILNKDHDPSLERILGVPKTKGHYKLGEITLSQLADIAHKLKDEEVLLWTNTEGMEGTIFFLRHREVSNWDYNDYPDGEGANSFRNIVHSLRYKMSTSMWKRVRAYLSV